MVDVAKAGLTSAAVTPPLLRAASRSICLLVLWRAALRQQQAACSYRARQDVGSAHEWCARCWRVYAWILPPLRAQ